MDILTDIIPRDWPYEIFHKDYKKLEVQLKVALFSSEDIKLWVKALEDKTSTSYSIKSTDKCNGQKVKFKQRLHCRHHTRHRDTYKTGVKNTTRNTNCPSSLIITLKPINPSVNPEMPCLITFTPTHNHIIGSADSLRCRKVSEETKQKLMDLFHLGHSPATALECLKFEIQLTHDNFETILADRSICPDYNFCYYLFRTEFEKNFGPVDFEDKNKTFLIEKLKEYNAKIGEECAMIQIKDSNYVIALCPPLFKRIHQNVDAASEIVLMDATAIAGSKIFILLTHSQCGGLPLGIFITSSEIAQNIALGFQMLKTMLGDSIFHGNPEGPLVFVTDDCEAEQTAIQSVWKKTKCLLSIFHLSQATYRWLLSSKNDIHKDCVLDFFQQFLSILYAPTVIECEQKYNTAIESAKKFPNYVQYLRTYWQIKEMWALSYRASLLFRGNHTNIISEAAMRSLKEKILNHVKFFNICQLVEFLMYKFVDYYTRRLLDAAHNRSIKDKLVQMIRLPPSDVLQEIEKLSESVYIVPSEKGDNLNYIVFSDILVCTCFSGNTSKICKHIDWVHMLYHSEAYQTKTDNVETRSTFFKIATGKSPPKNWLTALDVLPTETQDISITKDGPIPVQWGSASTPEAPTVIKRDEEERNALVDGQKTIGEISDCFNKFLKRSPIKAAAALKRMLDRATKVRSLTGMVSSWVTFGAAFQRRKLCRRIPVQPTAVSRPRTNMTGKQSRVGGRPRKSSKSKPKVPHCLTKRASET